MGALLGAGQLFSGCKGSDSAEEVGPLPPVSLGRLRDYPPGKHPLRLYRVMLQHEKREEESFLSAVSMVCTHMTCVLKPKSTNEGFRCPCHGSRFSATGARESGPAKEDLPWYEISIVGQGEILLHRENRVSAEWRYAIPVEEKAKPESAPA